MRSRSLLPPSIGLCALALLRCAPGSDDPLRTQVESCVADAGTTAAPSSSIALGRPESARFTPLAAGDVLPLHHGAQGGTHVYLDVAFHADKPAGFQVLARYVRGVGQVDSDATYVDACAGWNYIQNFRLIVNGTGPGAVDVTAKPVAGGPPELASVPVAVTVQ